MKNILGFILGAIISLILVEAYVSNSYVMDRYINDYDPEVGRIRKANTDYVKFNEGFGIGKVNNLNYLNKEYPIEKPKNTIRIALMGDSFVESFQVFDRNYFGRIMENLLTKKLNQPVEVLNFGRSGFDLGDCYVYYSTFVKKYNPDYVLYILGADDFKIRSSEPLLPVLKVTENKLEIERPYINSNYLKKILIMKPFLEYSVLINNLNKSRKLLTKDYILHQIFDKLYIKTEVVINTEKSVIPVLELTNTTEMILDSLEENSGYFFLRSNIVIDNNNYVFHNITKVFKKNIYNPNHWDITNTSGHWNNRAHKDVGQYLAQEMEKIIINELNK